MRRTLMGLGLFVFCLCLVGCGGDETAQQQPAAAGGQAAPAPAAGGAAPPGMAQAAPGGAMPPGMMPGMAPGTTGGTTATPAATPAAAPRDAFPFLPANITQAVGGRPGRVAAGNHHAMRAFVAQFSPLLNLLSRVGVPNSKVDNFWMARTADEQEKAICVILNEDLNVESIRTQLKGSIPEGSKIWPIPGFADPNYGMAIVDSRTLILGKKSTVDAALRKSPAPSVKAALGTVGGTDSDFWLVGDNDTFRQVIAGVGLPMLGVVNLPNPPRGKFVSFALAMNLDRPEVQNNNGMNGMMAPGMMPGGYSPMGMPTTTPMGGHSGMPTTTPMPMPMGGHAGAGHAGATGMGTTVPPMNTTAPPIYAPAGTEGNNSGNDPASQTIAVPTGLIGVKVVGGVILADEAAAGSYRPPLDREVANAARLAGPKVFRNVPNAGGQAGNQNGYPGAPGMMAPGMMPPGMGTTAPMGGHSASPGAPGTPGQPGQPGQPGEQVPVVLDPPSRPLPDAHLQPDNPPTIVDLNAPPASVQPGVPGMPMGTYPPGMSTTTPMGGHAGPMGMSTTSPMPMPMTTPMGGHGAAPTTYPGAMPGMTPGMMPGQQGQGAQWVHQQGAILQFAYRFDAWDGGTPVGAFLSQYWATNNTADPLASMPLTGLFGALQAARGAGNFAGTTTPASPSRGNSWMVRLLPHMGYGALADSYQMDKPWSDPENLPLTHLTVPQFLAPGDSRQQWRGAPYQGMGLTHYVGVSGAEASMGMPAAALSRQDPKAGVFGYDGIATPEQITDGQSNTLLMLNVQNNPGPWAVGGGATIRGVGPNSFAPHVGFADQRKQNRGVMALMADGSVRFISANVDPQLFQALSTTHGGEQVTPP